MDMVALYAAAKGWTLRPRIVLVEGTTDEALFNFADQRFSQAGETLLGADLCVLAAGRRDAGGTFGVARELITLRSMVPHVLDRTGRPAYQVLGLVDNDFAGRTIISDVVRLDRAALEFRDIIALPPLPPSFTSVHPRDRQRECDLVNRPFRDLDWEVEDTLSPRLLQKFDQDHPGMISNRSRQGGKTHHELTSEGKTTLHRYIRSEASLQDLAGVGRVVRMLRSMFG